MNEIYFQTVHQIIRTGHFITDQVNCELKELGYTESQFNVLRILRGAKGTPITVQDIQERMMQRSSNVTRIIDKLLKRSLVSRVENAENRRKMDIAITKEGLVLLKKLDKHVLRLHKPMMNNLSEKELITLRNLMIKLKLNKNA